MRFMWKSVLVVIFLASVCFANITELDSALGKLRDLVGGLHPQEAVQRVLDLNKEGKFALLNLGGEHYTNLNDVNNDVREYLAVMRMMSRAGAKSGISVKPTQIGIDISQEEFVSKLQILAAQASLMDLTLEVDMEQSEFQQATLEGFLSAKEHFPQARMRLAVQSEFVNSAEVAAKVAELGAGIRLVKGKAYSEAAGVYSTAEEIKDNYVRTAAAAPGFLAFGSSDTELLDRVEREVELGEGTEYQFLLGMTYHEKAAAALAEAGKQVTYYVPFGNWERVRAYVLRRNILTEGEIEALNEAMPQSFTPPEDLVLFQTAHKKVLDLVIGFTVEEAVERGLQVLADRGIRALLNLGGEHYDDLDRPAHDTLQYIRMLKLMETRGLKSGVSIKPTQLGLEHSQDAFTRNLMAVARVAQEAGLFVEVDMEQSQFQEITYNAVIAVLDMLPGLKMRLAVQAEFINTLEKVEKLVQHGGAIRLVKGKAYSEKGAVYETAEEISDNFVRIAQAAPINLALGTCDFDLIERVIDAVGDDATAIEYQFLLGMAHHEEVAAKLVSEGKIVTFYMPFGNWEAVRAYVLRRNVLSDAEIESLDERLIGVSDSYVQAYGDQAAAMGP